MIQGMAYPEDLAATVHGYLRHARRPSPGLRSLKHLFEVMYSASLRTDESRFAAFHIVFLDPRHPDPNPPKRITRDRWDCMHFPQAVPLSASSLVKLAMASDPRSSSIAVWTSPRGSCMAWGLVDQGNAYYQFAHFEAEAAHLRPGTFQASIAGLGHLVVYDGFAKVAELRDQSLVRGDVDALRAGPVRDALTPVIQQLVRDVRRDVGTRKSHEDSKVWDDSVADDIITALCRILGRVHAYRHGGALLITPRPATGLRVKYPIHYDRLRTALKRQAVSRIQSAIANDTIFRQYMDREADFIPVDLYLDEAISDDDLKESTTGIDGTLWFISLLSRVDGVVVLTPDLTVKGFGGEITVTTRPTAVWRAADMHGRRLNSLDYEHLGTRHRSMMRYCARVRGSLGFVVSQDGDIRAITQAHGRLLVWENIRLELYEFARLKKRSRI